MAVVVVTGASAGVGRATAKAFAGRRDTVALLARGADRLDAAAKEVEAAGGRPVTLRVDVADAIAVDRAAQAVEEEAGPIDIWVNNAMVSVFAPVRDLDPGEIRRVTEVTYLGCVNGTLAALARMRPRRRGTIVQVGSALAYRSIPLQAPYCGAKHAIAGFTESLRAELLHERSGVRVTQVHLSAINTPQFEWVRTRLPRQPQPVAPVFQPEVAARAIVWAADHAPRELKVAWPTVRTVWAEKLLPGLLDRYLARTGYDSQQGDEPLPADHGDNLFEPGPGDPGTHGRFDDIARARSLLLEARLALGGWRRAFRH